MSAADIRLGGQRLPRVLWWMLPGLLTVAGVQALFLFPPAAPVTRSTTRDLTTVSTMPVDPTSSPYAATKPETQPLADAQTRADAQTLADVQTRADAQPRAGPPAVPRPDHVMHVEATVEDLEVINMKEHGKARLAWLAYGEDVEACLKQKEVAREIDELVIVDVKPKWNGTVGKAAILDDLRVLPTALRECFTRKFPTGKREIGETAVNEDGLIRITFKVRAQ